MKGKKLNDLRRAVADYMFSSGCGCCKTPSNDDHLKKLAELLKVPKYEDGSGYNFYKFRTVIDEF